MIQESFACFPKTAYAALSEDRVYRYVLYRSLDGLAWDELAAPGRLFRRTTACFILTNPSTADEETNDPTVDKVMKQAAFFGYSRVALVNAFAYRETDSRKLPALAASMGAGLIGPHNDRWVVEVARASEIVICGWGNPGTLLGRDAELKALLRGEGINPYCIRHNQNRTPIHPLYQKDQPTLQEFQL